MSRLPVEWQNGTEKKSLCFVLSKMFNSSKKLDLVMKGGRKGQKFNKSLSTVWEFSIVHLFKSASSYVIEVAKN